MTDLSGKVTSLKFDENSPNNYDVDAHSLTPGMFLMQIVLKNGMVTNKKILIN